MCGICGIAYRDAGRPIEPEVIRRMAEAMRHRGPDGDGYLVAPGIGLGMRRLAIIDLETGGQPLANEDGTVAVICNGEIYNYLELRRELVARGHRFRSASDVEVIAHLYEDIGVRCLERLRGMFALALWDSRRRTLFLARDRLGIKPLHYALANGDLLFGSELKSILAAELPARELDPAALKDLFAFGFVRTPRTLFRLIRRLPPGHCLLYREGQLSISQYWDVRFPARGDEGPRLSEAAWAEALLAKLEEAVRLHMRSDVALGAFLSPGIDSSTIVALMGRLASMPIRAYSLAFEDPALDEVGSRATLDRFPGHRVEGRRANCQASDLALLPQALWHREDPGTSGLEIPYANLSAAAAADLKVVLTGEGADETLGGYNWYRIEKTIGPLRQLPRGLRRLVLLDGLFPRLWPRGRRVALTSGPMDLVRFRHLIGSADLKLGAALFSADLRHEIGDLARPGDDLAWPEGYPAWHPFAQLQYYDLKVRLPDSILHYVDRASMASSLEVRVPFLDHELVELAARVPAGLKMRALQEKYILRRAVATLLPPEIARRRKRGLAAPCDPWLRGELPEFAQELLSEGALRRKGYFDPLTVRRVLAQHRAGRGDYGQHLLGVLSVQLWDDLFRRGAGLGLPAEDAAGPRLHGLLARGPEGGAALRTSGPMEAR